MSDDIDIEEHDVLDNPRIKNIFPDLTTIKTEVEDYEETPVDEDHNIPYHCPVSLAFEEENYLKSFQNKIIIGTKLSTLQSEENVFQNKIIVGSKTYSQSSEDSEVEEYDVNDLPEVSVALEDWRPFLETSPCYCASCQILFPTPTALDTHKMTAHSFLVAVRKNKAIKSTTKGSIVPRIKFEPDNRQDLVCNHCNVVFPNEIALIKHTYELLPGNYESDTSDPDFEIEDEYKEEKADRKAAGMYLLCPICSCHFKRLGRLLTHMRVCHRKKNTGVQKHVPTNFECGFCGHRFKNSKHYNVHIQGSHSQLYKKCSNDDTISQFKCFQCNLSFSSEYSVRIHRAAKHGNVEETKTQAAGNGSPKTQALQKTESQNLVVAKPRLLPKSALFRCNKCLIHFVSCTTAVQHSKNCPMKKGEWECHKCKRSFRLCDRVYHNYQHGIVDRFKVIEVSANVLKRVLCRCRKCMVCSDEKSLVNLHSETCSGDSPSVKCKECHLWIHAFAVSSHKKIHAEGVTLKDFIMIDYVHIGAWNEPELAEATGSAELENAKPIYKVYYYCPTCKCFMQRNRHVDKHYIGQCNWDVKKYTCRHCGLRFTTKALKSHKMRHKKYPRMKLKDLTFANIQTDESIDPPFPEFKKCTLCRVRFFGDGALNNHLCNSEEPKVCIYCDEKFSDLAYKLHVPFHEYGNKTDNPSESIPEIMKKYESLTQVWNIVFLCETCDIVIDTYDKVIEHCQDHFCNMESYNVTIDHCEICDLNFVDVCYKRHEELHLSDDINKESFKILKYKYETLMTDAWLDIFVSLTKEQIDLVLSKSIYKFTRSVRMQIIVDGPMDLTLYKCGVCDQIVLPNKVDEHAQAIKCNDDLKNYKCSTCNLSFVAHAHKIAHEKGHEMRRLDETSYRIVQFLAEKQFDSKDPKTKAVSDELKFIRCQHCGKLINKQKYKSHIQYHNYYTKVKARSKEAKLKAIAEQQAIVHKFYKCKNCNTCVGKQYVKEHRCGTDKRKKCSKCFMFFKKQSLPSHYKYHEKYNLSRKNMNIIYFFNKKNKKINSKSVKVSSLTFYQCVDCSICLMRFCNIRRHTCPAKSYRVACDRCNLVLHSSHYHTHDRLHQLKQFSSKNVCVFKFKNGKIIDSRKTPTSSNSENRKRPSSPSPERPDAKRTKLKHESDVRVNHELSIKEYLKYINVRYYKCASCKLLFLTCSGLLAHEATCRDDRKGVKCEDCGLVLHHSMIQPHKNLQKCKLNKSSTLFVITIHSKGKFVQWDSWIYLCRQCDVYTMSFLGAMYHLKNGHKHLSDVRRCNKCDIQLSRQSHSMHLRIHHRSREVTLSDISIATVEDTSFESLIKDLPKDVNVALEDSSVSKSNQPSIPSIFRCDVCGLNFINIGSLASHKFYGRHDDKQYSCAECGLSFTNATLRRHTNLHHRSDTNRNKDQDDKEISDNDSILESVPRIFTEPEARPAVSQEPSVTLNKSKLFKCSLCDVYFLTADACYDHTSDHTALDPTEYIACKMCELQFPCEHLGRHMRSHRDNTFCMDNLSVAEYQPVSKGQIKVDTYLAVDRLKSKVTTTTHFDGENDKTDSGVNCVDSTTGNVPDSQNSANNAAVRSVACSEADIVKE